MKRNKFMLAGMLMWTFLMVTLCSTIQSVTLARYTAQTEGSVVARVAKWEPGVTDSNTLKTNILIIHRGGWNPFGWDKPGAYYGNPAPWGAGEGGNCLPQAVYTFNNSACEVSTRYTTTIYRQRDGADAGTAGILWSGDDPGEYTHPPWENKTVDMAPGQGAKTVKLYPIFNANYNYDDGGRGGAYISSHHAWYERIQYRVDATQID